MKKRSYLLSKSVKIPLKESIGEYDSNESLNIVMQNGTATPVVAMAGAPSTHSKTCSEPGDDDPDPGQEQCY
ncbi:MAG: hypothetical protein HQ507_08160 [Candidatus Marinimicrobia bacterium]|nr:hypothetical protein [Candidatus Neomarinimicrobiota bacterium]